LLLALFGALAILVPASRADAAEFEIVPDSFVARMFDAEGHPENRAGAHPNRLEVDFALHSEGTTARDFVFELPPGFGGNPGAVPECSRALFDAGEECPPESQVGILRFTFAGGEEAELGMFQLEPAAGEFLAFATVSLLERSLTTELRPSDFGITMKASELPKQNITAGHIELWGIPADHQVGTAIPRRPLLTTPTRCGPIVFAFRTRSWIEGAPWLSASSDTGAPLEGCAGLGFEPALGLHFDNPVADSPTGVEIEMNTPEEDGASELADALVEEVTIELPAGVTVSPAGAAGLAACTDVQLGLGNGAEAHCPAASKVGTVELASPALSDPLKGTVYLGEEHPSERFRLFVVAPGPGLVVKFVGVLRVDPATGRFSATLAGLPEIAFSRFDLSFDGGPGALLVSPLSCGPATATAKFAPYGDGPSVESRASVALSAQIAGTQCPGPLPFTPRLSVRGSRSGIGRPSTLSVTVLRHDGEATPRRFTLTLPAGLGTALGGVQACSDADVAAATCPASSRIGGLLAKAGSGASPVALRGDVYVTGPYRRAPFGLQLQLRAALGPFDLGTVAFRAAATVSGQTGRVVVSTDSLPNEIEGIPIRFQAIELDMDRPGLVRNPTSCRPAAVNATIEANSGALATARSPLALSGCHRLRFRPRFAIGLEGGGNSRQENPGLRISAHMRPGNAGLRGMKIVLPRAFDFDIGGLRAICSRPDATNGTCPPGARVGTAVGQTSLLSEPLRGGVYVVRPRGSGLPDLGVSIGAMGVRMAIGGRTESRNGHLVTKLVGLPDVPFSTFTMRMEGGKEGAFSLKPNLCKRGEPLRLASTVAARGQDGSLRKLRVPIDTNARCR
jgi:hypothetical protein